MEEIFQIRSCVEFWQMISKSTQLINICSTVNRELQGIHIVDLHHVRYTYCMTYSKTI